MKRLKLFCAIITSILFISCNETPNNPNDQKEIRFKMSYQKINHNGYNVEFKGTLYGDIDSIKTMIPECFLLGTSGMTLIRYALPDTFTYARREYIVEEKLNPGTYKISMILQLLDNTVIYSDTIECKLQ